jgi:acetoacetate decarboxylase
MTEDEVRKQAFAMPLSSPAFPPGPYRFVNREYLIVTYRTDPDKLAALLPAPLEMTEPIVKFEFIRMPDSTGFGDYTECGQVIPVSFRGERGGYTHAMYLNDYPPIAGGRELWGFPKKLAAPELRVDKDTISGVLRYGVVPVALLTMGYKHRPLAPDKALATVAAPGYLLKIIPHVDGSVRICELVRYFCGDITIKGAWEGPCSLDLLHHALAPVAALPVREIVSGVHILSDLTLGLGTVVYDYLDTRKEPS